MAKVINDYANKLYSDTEYFAFVTSAEKALKMLFAEIKSDIESGEDVRISGFGTFKLKTRAARPERVGRNPSTGEPVNIPAQPEKQVITFKQSKASK